MHIENKPSTIDLAFQKQTKKKQYQNRSKFHMDGNDVCISFVISNRNNIENDVQYTDSNEVLIKSPIESKYGLF